MSDLHLEFEQYVNGKIPDSAIPFRIPANETHKDTVLCLAGDIGVIDKPHTLVPFLESCSAQFKAVICVMGNHEYYHGSLITCNDKYKNMVSHLNNVYVLDNDSIEIEDVVFIGSTLWSDVLPQEEYHVSMYMADYKYIRTGTKKDPYGKKLWITDTKSLFNANVTYITSELQKHIDKKVCVMTHHLPSYQSVHQKFCQSYVNSAYASELSDLILQYNPNIWLHGHTHYSFDYMIGNTRVYCNPRGYVGTDDLNMRFTLDEIICL